jgi:hypothetical protein
MAALIPIGAHDTFSVMPGLVPGIHAVRRRVDIRTSTRFSASLAPYTQLAMRVPTGMAGTRLHKVGDARGGVGNARVPSWPALCRPSTSRRASQVLNYGAAGAENHVEVLTSTRRLTAWMPGTRLHEAGRVVRTPYVSAYEAAAVSDRSYNAPRRGSALQYRRSKLTNLPWIFTLSGPKIRVS